MTSGLANAAELMICNSRLPKRIVLFYTVDKSRCLALCEVPDSYAV
jgi:hypothetical protein